MNQNTNPLSESAKIQEEASSLGFDWPDISGVFEKVDEELNEVKQALAQDDFEHAKTELGDVLFATVNLARFLHVDPAEELHKANVRFVRRFTALNKELDRLGRPIHTCSLEELNSVWEQVKREAIEAKKRS